MKRAAVFALAALWVGCSDEPSPTSTGPTLPPSIEIVGVAAVGGPTWKPGADACVEIGRDPQKTVSVLIYVNPDGFTLRPPGTCGGRRHCGTVYLQLDPAGTSDSFHLEAAQSTLPVPFVGIALGSHTFHVELRDKNGKPVADPDGGGAPLAAEVTLEVKDVGGCGGPSDGGSDASDASDAGSEAAGDADVDASESDASDGGADAADAGSDGLDAADDVADTTVEGGGDAGTD